MPAGRPTKLTPEAIEKAIDYINGGYRNEGDVIPSIVGMACLLDVTAKTLYNWGESSEEFLYILEKCNTTQHNRLIQGGLDSEFNPTIAKLVLGKHGYHERQEVSGPDGEKLQINIVRHGDG